MTEHARNPRHSRRQILRSLVASGVCVFAGSESRGATWPSNWQVDRLRFHADFALRPDTDVVRETLDLYQTIPKIIACPANDELIYLYLFADKRTYQSYLEQYFPGVPYRRALFIKQRGQGMVFAYYSEDFAIDLRHETTHAVLHTILPLVPLWLDEGLAEYFEVPTAERFQGNPHLKQIRRYLRWRHSPDLAQLEAIRDLEQMDRDRYRDAWSWVHYLFHGPPIAQQEFRRYLADIHQHSPPGSLSRRLQYQIPDLPRSFADHFSQLDLTSAS